MNKLLLLSISFLVLILAPVKAGAVSCPSGLVNDSYPGECALYTDKDKNGLCDLSEVAENSSVANETVNSADLKDLITGKELKTKTVREAADLYKIDAEKFALELTTMVGKPVKPSDSFQLLHDNYGLSPDSAKDVAVALRLGVAQTNVDVKESTSEYYMLELTIIFVLLYVFSLFLVKRQVVSVVANRKFWNALLLLSFLVTALTSVFVLLRLNYGIIITFPLNLVYWHIEIGYVMLLISIFHTLWHLPYLKTYFKK